MKSYHVFYDATGYRSSTMVRARSKEEARAIVENEYDNCLSVTAVIGPISERIEIVTEKE